jgi:alkylhydroperoxidase family enzyme
MDDYRTMDWDALDPDGPRLRPLLDCAVALTRAPNGGGETAIVALRAAGWSDAAILEAVEVIGFFNYYNRMVDALGVAPEPEWGD